MNLLRYFAYLVPVLILGYWFLVEYSSVETKYECKGSIANAEEKMPITVFTKIVQYRWWVGLWSDNNGNVWVEIPNKALEYYEQMEVVGDQRQIYNTISSDGTKAKKMAGNFSTLSRVLALKMSLGFFDGKCEPIN